MRASHHRRRDGSGSARPGRRRPAGQACGDALGVPHEFGPSLADDVTLHMSGGGPFGFAPGEYSDDTAMAVCIAQVAATGADLTSERAVTDVAARFLRWGQDAQDVGNQTRAVFARTAQPAQMPATAEEYARTHEHSAGNGALMRTAVVGLSRLLDRDATAAAAAAVARLTHPDPLAIESCVLWSEAVRVAVVTGELDLLAGLDLLPASSRSRWRTWIDASTGVDPRTFRDGNGFTVTALQAAWAAITWTPGDGTQHLRRATENAVRTGNDTVAAIACGLLGARWGRSAIPEEWASGVHGYPSMRARDLVALTPSTPIARDRFEARRLSTSPVATASSHRSVIDALWTTERRSFSGSVLCGVIDMCHEKLAIGLDRPFPSTQRPTCRAVDRGRSRPADAPAARFQLRPSRAPNIRTPPSTPTTYGFPAEVTTGTTPRHSSAQRAVWTLRQPASTPTSGLTRGQKRRR